MNFERESVSLYEVIKLYFVMFRTNLAFLFLVLLFSASHSYSQKPTDIAGLTLWLKGDTGVSLNGANVSAWSDNSGKGHNALQGSDANQPSYIPNAINGYPALGFKDDYLNVPAMTLGERTEVMIIKRSGASLSPYHNILGFESDPYGLFSVFDDQNTFSTYVPAGQMHHNLQFTGTYQVVSRIISSSEVSMYRNGTAGTSGSYSSIPTSTQNLYIGTYSSGAPRYLNGEIAELLIYDNALSIADRQKVETYLMDKYSSTFSFDSEEIIRNDFCSFSLTTGSGYSSYLWSTGEVGPSINVSKSGKYWVKVTDIFGRVSSDTIKVSFPPAMQLASTNICQDSLLTWNIGLPRSIYDFLWQDGSTDSLIKITESGKYFYKITDASNCTYFSDTIKVEVDEFSKQATLGADRTLCSGNFLSLLQAADKAKSYLWSDNSTGPSLKVTSTGKYWLTVVSVNGCKVTDTVSVIVQGVAPTAEFNDVVSSCQGSKINYINASNAPMSDAIVSYQWFFGDGASSTAINPVYSYSTAGKFQVSLTVTTGLGCTGTAIDSIRIYPNPKSDFNYSLASGNTFQFADLSKNNGAAISTWSWNFGDVSSGANNISTITNPSHQYADLKKYDVSLVTQNIHGCKDSISKTIDLIGYVPVSLPGLTLWLKGDTGVALNGSNISGWSDNSGKGHNALQGSNSNQPSYVSNAINGYPAIAFKDDYLNVPAMTLGERTEILIIKKNGASPDAYHNILGFESSPYGLFSVYDDPNTFSTYVPAGQFHHNLPFTNTYQVVSRVISSSEVAMFRNGTGGTSGSYSSIPTTTQSLYIGTYSSGASRYLNGEIAELLIYDNALNTADRQKVEAYLKEKYTTPKVNLGGDKSLEYGFCGIILNPGPKYSRYKWSTGDTTQAIKVIAQGKYFIEVTDAFGNISRDTMQVFDKRIPLTSLSDSTICAGDSIKFSIPLNKNSYSFLWSNGNTNSSITISQSGDYFYTIKDSLNCSYVSDTAQIKVDDFENIASLGNDTTLCSGNVLQLISGVETAQKFIWSDGSIKNTLAVQLSGQYWLNATSINGCHKIDTINVIIKGMAPIADFSSTQHCLGDSTKFNDLSQSIGSPITKYEWNFGDSALSTLPNLSHLFKYSKDYLVKLKVSNGIGCSQIKEKKITVNPSPVVAFMAPQICSNSKFSVINLSTISKGNIAEWFWDFDASAISLSDTSNKRNPSFLYKEGGNYTIILKATSDKGCIGSQSQVIAIKESPNVNFSYSPTCEGTYMKFIDISESTFPTSIVEWSWDFGDGSPQSINDEPLHLYFGSGEFNVKLSVKATNNCSASIIKKVNVNPKPKVSFTNGTICSGILTQFSNNSTISNGSIKTWKWNFGGFKTDTIKNPSLVFPDSGSYTIKLVATSLYGCKDSIVKKLHSNVNPKALFSFSPTFGSAPLNVKFSNTSTGASSFKWSFGDSSPEVIGFAPSHIYGEDDTFKICLVATNTAGCISQLCKEIRLISSKVDLSIKDIGYQQRINDLSISANISNLGTRDIYSFDISADIGNGLIIKENFDDTIKAGETINYKFKGTFKTSSYNPPVYFCVEVIGNDGQEDEVVSNNKECMTFSEDFHIVSVFPNPSENDFKIQFVLEDKDEVVVILFDQNGKIVREIYSGFASKGLNEITINTGDLDKGVYFCRFKIGDILQFRKIIKM